MQFKTNDTAAPRLSTCGDRREEGLASLKGNVKSETYPVRTFVSELNE